MTRHNTFVQRDPETGRNVAYDLTGFVRGKLTVIESTGLRCPNGYVIWRARCTCGEFVERPSYRFVNAQGRKPSESCPKCAPVGRPRKGNQESIVRSLWKRVKRGADDRGIEFDLTIAQARVLFESDCTYCGSPPLLRIIERNLAGMYAWNGIDRTDSSSGYKAGNVVSCCHTCNFAKLDMSVGEFRAWIDRAYKHQHRRDREPALTMQLPLDLTAREVHWLG